ncbi:hypothetical protein [Microbacterium nymphoidis]|uniref:hypothetical protein n=1 Tax=Microbacterium nymphoidis TaxID=2898586 RepID=UPI001E4D3923|nr:hypothetical protein [Microbacterium nymphoidis]MCD2497520.1 hypothetical protein [Microbacterium nymphoidis]
MTEMTRLQLDRDGWFCLIDPHAFASYVSEAPTLADQLTRYAAERQHEHGIVMHLGPGAALDVLAPAESRPDRPIRTFTHTIVASHGVLAVPTFKELTGAAGFSGRRLVTEATPRIGRPPGRYLVVVAQYQQSPRITLSIAPAVRPAADPAVLANMVPWI